MLVSARWVEYDRVLLGGFFLGSDTALGESRADDPSTYGGLHVGTVLTSRNEDGRRVEVCVSFCVCIATR